jgi:protein CWC15
MVRDLPSHLLIKRREKQVYAESDLKAKLDRIAPTRVSVDEAKEFEDIDADDSDSHIPTDDSDAGTNEEVLRELARLKREKAEEEARKLEQGRSQAQGRLSANPLIDGTFSLKLKWTEESVFHHQSATEPVRKGSDFVNDPVRNENHHRFLQKYLHT